MKRKIKAICSIVLIIILIVSQTVTAYAIGAEVALLLGISPQAVTVIVLALIAAGLTMYTLPQVYNFVVDYYNQAAPEIKTWLANVASGTVTLTDSVWNSIRSYVQGKFTTEGEQTVYLSGVITAMTFSNGSDTWNITNVPSTRILAYPVLATHAVIGINSVGDIYAMYTDAINYGLSWNETIKKFTVSPNSSYGSTIYLYNKNTGLWDLWGSFSGSNNKSIDFYCTYSNIYFIPLSNDSGILESAKTKWEIYAAKGCPYLINTATGTATAQSVVLNPTWDWTNQNTGDRDLYIPDVTTESIDNVVTSYLGETMDDVIGQTVPDTPIDLAPTNTLLQNIYDGILSIPQGITNIYDRLFEPINTGTLIDSIKGKFEIDRLQTSWNLLQNMDTSQGSPPCFKVNLNQLFNTTSAISGKSNVFPEGDTVLLDFAEFEKYTFMGMNLTQLIRTIISTGFILTTFGYVSRKFAPDKVIGGGS